MKNWLQQGEVYFKLKGIYGLCLLNGGVTAVAIAQRSKMQKILCCYWLPERTIVLSLPRSGLPAVSRENILQFMPHNK